MSSVNPGKGLSSTANSRTLLSRAVQITFGAGPNTRWNEEQRTFLYQRLRILSLALFVMAILVHIRVFAVFEMWGHLCRLCVMGMIVSTAAVLVIAGLLLFRPNPSWRSLRQIEVLLMLATIVGNFCWCYGWMQSGRVVTSGSSAQELLGDAVWLVAPNRVTQFRVGPTLIGFPMINNWSLISVVYGALIPNTWRRGIIMQGVILLGALATLILSTHANPGLGPLLPSNVSTMATTVGTLAAIGLYSGHKFEDLRRQVFDAQQIGQYVLTRQIGKGAMGEVYLAQHRMLRRPCALKLIRPEQAGSQDYLARFEREAQAMAHLTHPNTVEVYDFGRTEDGAFFYAMEYLPGMNLDAFVRKYGPLPPGRVVHLLRQVCGALSEAHRHGLIHRDIKPGNMILCERGGIYDIVKLVDFGLVYREALGGRALSGLSWQSPVASDQEHESLPAGLGQEGAKTFAGMMLGTPAYMSPEQVCGEPADARSDLYSLGGVAYYLLTGKQPFERPTLAELCLAHVSAPLPSLRMQGISVPADLEAIILRCLAKVRTARYQSAQELSDALGKTAAASEWDSGRAESFWRTQPAGSELAGSEPAGPEPAAVANGFDETLPGAA